MMVYKNHIALLLVASLLFIGGIALTIWALQRNPSNQSSTPPLPSLIDAPTLTKLALSDAPIDQSHLSEQITPPTNKWFSGFALQADPKPGYNYPTSFLPRKSGFEFSLPNVQATPTTISGVHTDVVSVTINEAVSYKITDYDELVIKLTYYNNDQEAVAAVHVASGLPYVYVRAVKDLSIQFNGTVAQKNSWAHIQSTKGHYGTSVSTADNHFTLKQGSHASFFSAPSESTLETVASHADTFVESGQVSYERQGEQFVTTLSYVTTDNKPVLFAYLPHQSTDDTSSVTYQSILGDLPTKVGTTFSFETPAITVPDKLNITAISTEQKELLSRQLARDVAVFEPRTDTYFGGKQLYRMAQLLTLAHQLDSDSAATAHTTLKRELSSWLTLGKTEPQSFSYDPSMQGIVGNEASFGSDKEFNDHHFHYGYFIYAAAILAEYDKEFFETHKATINLLVADIANYNTGEELPLRRSFDPYAGHSWASGIVPFKDGNNQESTSEAINAWVAVSLWAERTHNDALGLQANWMLSQEFQTAQHYWLLRQQKTPDYLSRYTSPLVSIVWGGKREYATFFSDEPNAKLAIQLLPLSPTMKHHLTPLPKELFYGTSTTKTYGDSILMATPGASLKKAVRLPNSAIDDGNSRAYMYAYILAAP